MKLSTSLAASLLPLLVTAQGGAWAQCGGIDFSGPSTCVSGYTCTVINPYYHQCLPGTTTSAPPSSTTTTSQPPPASTTTTRASTSSSTTGPSPPAGTCPSLPTSLGPSSTILPDPFTFQNGAKVQTRADWTCRQREIQHQIQTYELGSLPPKPQTVTGSYSGNKLTINVSDNGRSISFAVTINKPSGAGTSVPAIIAYGAASIPIPAGVATIVFDNGEIAAQAGGSSRGQGKFYTLYGRSHSAGAMTAWAWGVARILDALESTPSAGIDATRVGVTGCSRNGKGAIVAGALEPRIALTLPQESGSGGSACWRLSDWQKSRGANVQTASQIVGENVWLGPAFNSYVNNVNALPFDHHSLAALIAPRALYVMENSDMEWLGSTSTYGCMGAARKVWEALGALDNFGYSQVGGNSHCSFPSAKQGSELNAFIGKFLLRSGSGATSIYRTEGSHSGFSLASWAPWTVPRLS